MTAYAYTRDPHPDREAANREAARPLYGDCRCHSDSLASPFVPDTAAVNRVAEPVTEPDRARLLQGLVALFVKPLVYDFRHGHTS